MDVLLGLACYIILWWVAFFMMLPIGVRNLDEAGVEAHGHDRGAPEKPDLKRKAVWAAGLALILWIVLAVTWWFVYYRR